MADDAPARDPRPDEEQETWHRFLRLDSYGLVLVLILVIMILPAITPTTWAWRIIIGHAVVAAVLLSLHTADAPRWLFWGCVSLSAVVIGWLYLTPESGRVLVIPAIAMAILLIVAPAAILNRIARHRTVTLRTLLGAIVVYFQIGFAFSFFYEAMYRLDSDAFRLDSVPDRVEFTYFSFVTIATLGYGDIVPTTDAGRIMAVFETVIGQIFLVAIVARIVSLLPGRREHRGSDRGAA